ncbi:MAG: hypothetical protein LBQ51_10690 [Desulfovibrio sp.]|jgi:hypothetical protein|nr:hypothetical protein [Desulfovibrio sp.]
MADDPNSAGSGNETQLPDAGAGADAGAGGDGTTTAPEGGAPTTLLGVEPDAGKDDAGGDKGEGKEGDGKAPKDKQDEDPASKVPDTPEGYDLKFAEGTKVDEELLSGFKTTALELGLTQGQSQKLASLYEAHAVKTRDAVLKAQMENVDKAQGEWEAEIKGEKDFDANLAYAQKTLRQFGNPELTEVLNQTRMGSFPPFYKFMVSVGKALAEPGFRGDSAMRNSNIPLRDRMWPDK